MREQFTFYRSFWEAAKEIEKPRDRLSFIEAVISFALDEEEREVTKAAKPSYILCKPTLLTSAKKAKAGKLGGEKQSESKQEAKAKQGESKQGAKAKQTRSYIEGEKEIEGEIESECYTRARAQSFDDLALQSAFEDWLAYKREKRQQYKPTGLKTLVAEIQRNADTYGADAVVALIRESMAANWQGIAFDRLARTAPKQRTVGQPGTVPETPRTVPIRSEIEANRAFLEELRKA